MALVAAPSMGAALRRSGPCRGVCRDARQSPVNLCVSSRSEFWLADAVLPAPGSSWRGGARSLTTPSPLRCDAVVNDLGLGLVGQVERMDGGGQGAGGMVMMIWRESREIETTTKQQKNKRQRIGRAVKRVRPAAALVLAAGLTSYMICK